MGVDSRKNGGRRTCQREQRKASWSPGVEAGEVEITLGVCGEMPGPVRSTWSSFVFVFVFARHANDTRRASLLCLQPPPAAYGLRRHHPRHAFYPPSRNCNRRAACGGHPQVTWTCVGAARPAARLVNQKAARSPLISIRSLAPERLPSCPPPSLSSPRPSDGSRRPGRSSKLQTRAMLSRLEWSCHFTAKGSSTQSTHESALGG